MGKSKELQTTREPRGMDVFAVPNADSILFFEGYPLQYRGDAKAGQFKFGDSELIGSTLDMQVLSVNPFEAELFNYKIQQWVQLFFIDGKGAVSHTLLRGGETIRNFQGVIQRIAIARKSIASCIITGSYEPRTMKDTDGNKVSYFVLKFSYSDAPKEQYERAVAWMNSRPKDENGKPLPLSCVEINEAINRH